MNSNNADQDYDSGSDYDDADYATTLEDERKRSETRELIRNLPPVAGPKGCPARRSAKGGWTEEEDELLRRAVQQHGGKNWRKIALLVPNRTDVQCLHRWQKVLNPSLVKGPWTKEEDEIILRLVREQGAKKWSQIARHLQGRIGKQCRERWHNHLNPAIKKEAWSEEETELLLQAHQTHGNKWAEIAKMIPGRSDNAIKNHWNSCIKKRADYADIMARAPACAQAAAASIPTPTIGKPSPPTTAPSETTTTSPTATAAGLHTTATTAATHNAATGAAASHTNTAAATAAGGTAPLPSHPRSSSNTNTNTNEGSSGPHNVVHLYASNHPLQAGRVPTTACTPAGSGVMMMAPVGGGAVSGRLTQSQGGHWRGGAVAPAGGAAIGSNGAAVPQGAGSYMAAHSAAVPGPGQMSGKFVAATSQRLPGLPPQSHSGSISGQNNWRVQPHQAAPSGPLHPSYMSSGGVGQPMKMEEGQRFQPAYAASQAATSNGCGNPSRPASLEGTPGPSMGAANGNGMMNGHGMMRLASGALSAPGTGVRGELVGGPGAAQPPRLLGSAAPGTAAGGPGGAPLPVGIAQPSSQPMRGLPGLPALPPLHNVPQNGHTSTNTVTLSSNYNTMAGQNVQRPADKENRPPLAYPQQQQQQQQGVGLKAQVKQEGMYSSSSNNAPGVLGGGTQQAGGQEGTGQGATTVVASQAQPRWSGAGRWVVPTLGGQYQAVDSRQTSGAGNAGVATDASGELTNSAGGDNASSTGDKLGEGSRGCPETAQGGNRGYQTEGNEGRGQAVKNEAGNGGEEEQEEEEEEEEEAFSMTRLLCAEELGDELVDFDMSELGWGAEDDWHCGSSDSLDATTTGGLVGPAAATTPAQGGSNALPSAQQEGAAGSSRGSMQPNSLGAQLAPTAPFNHAPSGPTAAPNKRITLQKGRPRFGSGAGNGVTARLGGSKTRITLQGGRLPDLAHSFAPPAGASGAQGARGGVAGAPAVQSGPGQFPQGGMSFPFNQQQPAGALSAAAGAAGCRAVAVPQGPGAQSVGPRGGQVAASGQALPPHRQSEAAGAAGSVSGAAPTQPAPYGQATAYGAAPLPSLSAPGMPAAHMAATMPRCPSQPLPGTVLSGSSTGSKTAAPLRLMVPSAARLTQPVGQGARVGAAAAAAVPSRGPQASAGQAGVVRGLSLPHSMVSSSTSGGYGGNTAGGQFSLGFSAGVGSASSGAVAGPAGGSGPSGVLPGRGGGGYGSTVAAGSLAPQVGAGSAGSAAVSTVAPLPATAGFPLQPQGCPGEPSGATAALQAGGGACLAGSSKAGPLAGHLTAGAAPVAAPFFAAAPGSALPAPLGLPAASPSAAPALGAGSPGTFLLAESPDATLAGASGPFHAPYAFSPSALAADPLVLPHSPFLDQQGLMGALQSPVLHRTGSASGQTVQQQKEQQEQQQVEGQNGKEGSRLVGDGAAGTEGGASGSATLEGQQDSGQKKAGGEAARGEDLTSAGATAGAHVLSTPRSTTAATPKSADPSSLQACSTPILLPASCSTLHTPTRHLRLSPACPGSVTKCTPVRGAVKLSQSWGAEPGSASRKRLGGLGSAFSPVAKGGLAGSLLRREEGVTHAACATVTSNGSGQTSQAQAPGRSEGKETGGDSALPVLPLTEGRKENEPPSGVHGSKVQGPNVAAAAFCSPPVAPKAEGAGLVTPLHGLGTGDTPLLKGLFSPLEAGNGGLGSPACPLGTGRKGKSGQAEENFSPAVLLNGSGGSLFESGGTGLLSKTMSRMFAEGEEGREERRAGTKEDGGEGAAEGSRKEGEGCGLRKRRLSEELEAEKMAEEEDGKKMRGDGDAAAREGKHGEPEEGRPAERLEQRNREQCKAGSANASSLSSTEAATTSALLPPQRQGNSGSSPHTAAVDLPDAHHFPSPSSLLFSPSFLPSSAFKAPPSPFSLSSPPPRSAAHLPPPPSAMKTPVGSSLLPPHPSSALKGRGLRRPLTDISNAGGISNCPSSRKKRRGFEVGPGLASLRASLEGQSPAALKNHAYKNNGTPGVLPLGCSPLGRGVAERRAEGDKPREGMQESAAHKLSGQKGDGADEAEGADMADKCGETTEGIGISQLEAERRGHREGIQGLSCAVEAAWHDKVPGASFGGFDEVAMLLSPLGLTTPKACRQGGVSASCTPVGYRMLLGELMESPGPPFKE